MKNYLYLSFEYEWRVYKIQKLGDKNDVPLTNWSVIVFFLGYQGFPYHEKF